MSSAPSPFPGVGELYTVHQGEAQFLVDSIFGQEEYVRGGVELKGGDLVVDVGANIGVFSLFAAKKCGGQLDLYSFEPIPATFEVLQRNVRLHGLQQKIRTFQLGMTHSGNAGEATFTHYTHCSLSSTMRPEDKAAATLEPLRDPRNAMALLKQVRPRLHRFLKICFFLQPLVLWIITVMLRRSVAIKCRLTTLSDVIRQERLPRIDLLKVDVEGAEWDVLRGLDDAHWPLVKQVVVELYDLDHRLKKVSDLLAKWGFACTVEQNELSRACGMVHYMVYARRIDPALPVPVAAVTSAPAASA